MLSGRERFHAFLNYEPLTCPAFIPFLGGLLSRISDHSMETLTSDPALWANSYDKTTRLFGFDGVVTGFDSDLSAAACGCKIQWENDHRTLLPLENDVVTEPHESPEMALALDVAQRTFSVARQNLGCITSLTGPYRLAGKLFGEQEINDRMAQIKPLMVKMTEAYCNTQPDALIFREDAYLANARIEPGHRRMYNTLKNIASYFDIPSGLYLEGFDPDNLPDSALLGMDFYILGPSVNKDLSMSEDIWDLGDGSAGLGIGLPIEDVEQSTRLIHDAVELYRKNPGHGLFFTSRGSARRDLDLDHFHTLVSEISKIQSQLKGNQL